MTTARTSLHAARALLALAALAATACATTSPKPQEDLRWPLPPEIARVKFVRSIRTGDDIKSSAWRRFWRSLVEDKSASVVDMPTGLALSVDEKTLYVASPTASPVLAIDLVQGRVTQFASHAETRPRSPYGIAVDGDDNVYVADSVGNVVIVYSRDGKLVRKITEKVERPTGIAIDRRRQLVYVVSGVTRESSHHRVEAFGLDGKHRRTIGTRGTAAGEFNFPGHLAVSANGTLYVSDMLNFRIQQFDAEGNLQGMFGAPGRGPGLFDKAKGVAFDSFGNVYVADGEQAIVQIFNSQHQVLMGFGGRLERRGFMIVPTGLAIDSKNTIYVADYAAKCVNEYQLVNTTAADSFPDEQPSKPATAPSTPGAGSKPTPPLPVAPTPAGQKPQGG